jgi:hypothetical protein
VTPLDLFALALMATGAAGGWYLTARRRWKLLTGFGVVAGLGLALAVRQTQSAEDWDAYLYLAVALFLTGPVFVGLFVGALARGIYGWFARTKAR